MEKEHDALDPTGEIVAEKRPRVQVALTLEHDVVDGVVDVDEESADGNAGGERPGAGDSGSGGAGGNGGDEMTARTHAVLAGMSRAVTRRAGTARVARRDTRSLRNRAPGFVSGPTTGWYTHSSGRLYVEA